ncbi:MAG: lipopolysaccharide biosynthesis protein [Bacteroidales bacterium]|nr:lipopolysaccharide biosynthesis protein [Bacteroidales bacterium]MCF8402535.1 lipopolysaccharide biosynthesis protein [Bacteroidales bacterium]
MGLKSATISGMVWSFAEQIGNRIIQFIIGIILARLLLPAEFGLIGMITIFVAVSESIASGGFVQALIRKQNCTKIDYNTAFIFNFFTSIFLYGILFISAPYIADFYTEPQLISLVRVLCLVIVIDAFAFVQRAKLYKDVNFKVIAKASVISQLVGGVAGVAAAFAGYGVWSLIIKMVLNHFIMMINLIIINRWLPNFTFSKKSFKEMFGFGSKILATQIIERIYKNIYFLIIGKFFSATELGYYTRANQFKSMVSDQLVSTVQRVTLPILAKVQDNQIKLVAAFNNLIKMVLFVSSFLLIGLVAMSEPMILFLIGEKWEQSILYLQLLAISAILYPIGEINLNVLQVYGRSDYILKLQIIKKIISIPVIILGVILGIKYLIFGIILLSIFEFFANSYYSGKMINTSSIKQLQNSFPSLLILSVISLGTFIISKVLTNINIGAVFGIQIVFYLLVSISIFEFIKKEEYLEVKKIVFDSVAKIRKKKVS